jgi:hypothetical protein
VQRPTGDRGTAPDPARLADEAWARRHNDVRLHPQWHDLIAEALRLKPALRSIARMRAENPWLKNPQYWALQERTLNLGLRRAGFPDH